MAGSIEPILTAVVIHSNEKIVDLTGSTDKWIYRKNSSNSVNPSRSSRSFSSVKINDGFVTLKRDALDEPVEALVMSFFNIKQMMFCPDVEVKLTMASAGYFSYSNRIIYTNDKSFNDNFNLKGICVPGDGHELVTKNFIVESENNQYEIRSFKDRRIYILYSNGPFEPKLTKLSLKAGVKQNITPVDIDPFYRYIHIVYFEPKGTVNSLNLARLSIQPLSELQKLQLTEASRPLCVVCITDEADHMITPCNHICLCGSCQSTIEKNFCPICRRSMSTIVKVYFS